MKKYIIIFIISIISCKENRIDNQVKRDKSISNKETVDNEIRKLTDLFMPEKMETEEIKTEFNKKNYQITFTNSDLLDKDLKNIKLNSDKIASIYNMFLMRINNPLNYDKIIVKIIHRNGKINVFEYSEKEMLKISEKNKN